MILIADSGATKTDWRVIDHLGKIHQAKTQGFNPVYQGFEQIRDEINKNLLGQIEGLKIDRVFYYGAGCTGLENCEIINKALAFSFPEAEIEINDDLLAAARSLCDHEKGIACILGTGSNSCLYDGKSIIDHIPPLGYILGDEGSGAYLGKILLRDFIRGSMPNKLRSKMKDKFNLDKAAIIDKVYNQDRPSRFVAGFAKFIFDNIRDPYAHQLVYNGFRDFFNSSILRYSDHQKIKVHFSGGIAFNFNNILRQVAEENGVTVGNIAENPIAGLTLYHKEVNFDI